VLKAVLMDHVQGRLEHRDTLLIPVHFLVVSICLSLDLLSHCIHESSDNFIELFFVLKIVNWTSICSWSSCFDLVFDHSDIGVDLCKSNFNHTQKSCQWERHSGLV
jgi:hypothetical protein